jgi:mitochondrial fission protein ELM1
VADQLLPPGTTAWIFCSGKIGHEANCRGVAAAFGLEAEEKLVRPRKIFDLLAPWGPVDPRDAPGKPGALLTPPFPDIAIAAGRVTVPYLRRLKKASGGRTFTVFLQDPRTGPKTADLIWVPEHDRLRGPNVLVTLTSPHPLRPHVLEEARQNPDPHIAALRKPVTGMILGGPSGTYRFEQKDREALAAIARQVLDEGSSLMATPSRRTPPEVLNAIREATAHVGPDRAFVWDNTGPNPYSQMLAHADRILVTADSVNMVGEACASGAPVHVFEPTSDGPSKTTGFVDRLIADGMVRRWGGKFEDWRYAPLDATGLIAREVAKRFGAFRNGL